MDNSRHWINNGEQDRPRSCHHAAPQSYGDTDKETSKNPKGRERVTRKGKVKLGKGIKRESSVGIILDRKMREGFSRKAISFPAGIQTLGDTHTHTT